MSIAPPSRLVRRVGMVPIEVSIPNWPYDSLDLILFAGSRGGVRGVDAESWRGSTQNAGPRRAWPNIFRQSRFLSAVDFVQSDRFRRKVAAEMARVFSEVDVLLVLFSCATRC